MPRSPSAPPTRDSGDTYSLSETRHPGRSTREARLRDEEQNGDIDFRVLCNAAHAKRWVMHYFFVASGATLLGLSASMFDVVQRNGWFEYDPP